jgi:hypothetical protein
VASWAVLTEQVVWISERATGFTVVCERCAELGELFPSVQATLSLEHLRGTIECQRGHQIRVEREGR